MVTNIYFPIMILFLSFYSSKFLRKIILQLTHLSYRLENKLSELLLEHRKAVCITSLLVIFKSLILQVSNWLINLWLASSKLKFLCLEAVGLP
jgi:hypothetical protein